jgi:hypothetical protein
MFGIRARDYTIKTKDKDKIIHRESFLRGKTGIKK